MTDLLDRLPRALEWHDGDLYLLDQTRLPLEEVVERQDSVADVFEAIRVLKVRGAPAIGVAAAYGLCVALGPLREGPVDAMRRRLPEVAAYLNAARPTAVNLSWALRRMEQRAARSTTATTAAELYAALVDEAEAIHREDQALCLGIGEAGAALIAAGAGVLTHCNAGALATSGIGTATAPMYLAHRAGVPFRVYADETRPLLQGARLTSWELGRAGVDVTLIADTMTASMMAEGRIDLVITGTDRVAANGDVANKIGTLGVAILARHFGIPFYVACPSSTIDLDCPTGADIPIEERASDEVTSFGARRTAPDDVKVRNPAFDVTPNELVTGLITERGIVSAPYGENLARLFGPDAPRRSGASR
ncbi:MAG: S-methyl-5-thioribose-1-phosphate isomerase [Bauldia sp.]|nr:S-methyl-5-thioribose-1-phosphate isomerase [Bauldia sp.]